jgi:cysteinyl-tRNA synthetase
MQPRTWYKAKLTPVADGLFTDAFYPEANRLGNRYVYFTQVNVTDNASKVIVASRAEENSVRMLTRELAQKMLLPVSKLSVKEAKAFDLASVHCRI